MVIWSGGKGQTPTHRMVTAVVSTHPSGMHTYIEISMKTLHITLPQTSFACGKNCSYDCFNFIQVKIWNTSNGTNNNPVTLVTENLECDVKNLFVYTGHGDVMTTGVLSNRSHFHGNHKMLNLESSVTDGNGQECVFECEDMCHNVFISVQNIPDESSWKL